MSVFISLISGCKWDLRVHMYAYIPKKPPTIFPDTNHWAKLLKKGPKEMTSLMLPTWCKSKYVRLYISRLYMFNIRHLNEASGSARNIKVGLIHIHSAVLSELQTRPGDDGPDWRLTHPSTSMFQLQTAYPSRLASPRCVSVLTAI